MTAIPSYVMHELPEDYGLEILRSEVGSTLHGTGLTGAEDRDEMGLYVEWPNRVLGFTVHDQYIWRSVDDSHHFGPAKSQHGDTDLVIYSLRKWARLAMHGNPSVMLLLYSPDDRLVVNTEPGRELRSNAHRFVARSCGKAFGGYLVRQRERMMGQRGTAGRVRRTPTGEVDWKYAMHMCRLGYQGVELLGTGKLTLPIEYPVGEVLRAIRRGDVPLDTVLDLADDLLAELNRLSESTELPKRADEAWIEDWIERTYRQTWERLPWAR